MIFSPASRFVDEIPADFLPTTLKYSSNILGRRCIYPPNNFSVWRADDLGGVLIWLVWALENGMESVCFIASCGQEKDGWGRVQQWWCGCQAVRMRVWNLDPHDHAPLFIRRL